MFLNIMPQELALLPRLYRAVVSVVVAAVVHRPPTGFSRAGALVPTLSSFHSTQAYGRTAGSMRLEYHSWQWPLATAMNGAPDRNRTGTRLLETDFKSAASTNSATGTHNTRLNRS